MTTFNHTEFFNEWRKENPPEPIENIEVIDSQELKEHLEWIVSEHIDFHVGICRHNGQLAILVHNFHGEGFSDDMLMPFYKEGFQLVDIETEQMEEDKPLDETLEICLTFIKSDSLVVDTATGKKLRLLGVKNETYEDIILKSIDHWRKTKLRID